MFSEPQKAAIQEIFEDAKIAEDTASVHVDNLTDSDIVGMATLHVEHGVEINCKRSGTGITVNLSPVEK
jgi:hypothetical protein